MKDRVAHHFGPDVRFVGGMASVLLVLQDRQVGADRVIVHSTWVPDDRLATVRAWVSAIRVVHRLKSDDVVHVHLSEGGSFIREGALLVLARQRGLTAVATLHGADFERFATKHPRVARAVLSSAKGISALSPAVVARAHRLAPDAHCVLVPNPVVPDESATPAGDTPPTALFAGEIGYRKGVDVLLEAWPKVRSRVPDAILVLIGPQGDLAPRHIEGVEFLPPGGPDDVRLLMRSARVVVLPSRAEAMPMTLLEAAACARPFVCTPVGGVAEIAEEGGSIVPVGDPEALAKALITYLTDPDIASATGNRGLAATHRRRSPAVVGDLLESLYDRSSSAERG